jgi:hypothetical protein
MTEVDEKDIRRVVREEILAIINDAKAQIGMKDPTGFGKKALDGLAYIVRRRQSGGQAESK